MRRRRSGQSRSAIDAAMVDRQTSVAIWLKEGSVKHALIVGECEKSRGQIADSLWEAGYHSMTHVLDDADARVVLASIRPTVIVLLSATARSLSAEALCDISRVADAPLIVPARDPAHALRCINEKERVAEPRAVRPGGVMQSPPPVADRCPGQPDPAWLFAAPDIWQSVVSIEADQRRDYAERETGAKEQAERVRESLKLLRDVRIPAAMAATAPCLF
jgi:hypothetical protein